MALMFGELLRHYRKKRGLTQRNLAQQAGVTGNYIAVLEGGRSRNPSRSLLWRLCRSMKLDPKERDRLYLAAGYAPPTGDKAQSRPHVAHEALRRFLALSRGSPKLSEAFQDVIQELLGAAAQRGAAKSDKSSLRRAQLLGLGYFHSTATSGPSHAVTKRSSNYDRKQERLARAVADLLNTLANNTVDISKRINLAEELNSLAQWKIGREASAGIEPKRGKSASTRKNAD